MQLRAIAALAVLAGGCSCGEETLPCRVEPRDDGRRYLVCPDGSETPLPGEGPGAPLGAVTGIARPFGRQASGLRVHASGTGQGAAAVTDAGGRYRLEGIPPGHRTLSFESPGYVTETRPALVLPGTLELPDPVTLWAGRLVRAGAVSIQPLSGGRQFLAVEAGGELALWDGKEGTSVVLHAACGSYRVTDRHVFFTGQDDPTKRPALYRFDRASGERLRLFEEVLRWEVARDGVAVAAEVPTAESLKLRIWDAATGRVATPTAHPGPFHFGPEGRRLLFLAGDATVLWDVAAVAGTVLGASSRVLGFGATDDLVLLEGRAVDVLRERAWDFTPGASVGLVAGGRFAVGVSFRLLDVVDLETGFREAVPFDGAWTADDEGGLAFVRAEAGVPTLFRRDLATGATVALATGEAITGLAPVPGGRLLYLRFQAGQPVTELWDPARGTVLLESFPGPGAWSGTVTPDGAAILHGNGGRLSRYDLATGDDETVADEVWDFPLGSWHPWWGPGGRFALVAGGTLAIWDPALGLRSIGPGPGPTHAFAFLPDGAALALRHHTGAAGELVHVPAGAGEPRLLAEGVTHLAVGDHGVGFHSLGRPELPPLVFHRLDLGTGRSLPLEAEVGQVVFGEGFLAYTAAPGEEGSPRAAGLYLVSAEALRQIETSTEAP